MSVVPEIPSGSNRCVRGNGIASAGADLVAKRDALGLPIGPSPDSLDRFIGATASIPSEVSYPKSSNCANTRVREAL